MPEIIDALPALDVILAVHADAISADLERYRNHCYRVANFCAAQTSGGTETLEKIGAAVAFHDLGIWTAHTFDYLEPSVELARDWLARQGRGGWEGEIVEIIRQHHKISAYRGTAGPLVEPFRRSDWIDVTSGVLRFGVPRSFIREIYSRWPSAGFHTLLVRLELRHVLAHPLNPLPVFKL